MSHPQWTWSRLRKERTGQYEKGIKPAPDGDQWFHAKVVLVNRQVKRVRERGKRTELGREGIDRPD